MKDDERLFCSRPFRWFEVTNIKEIGDVSMCCPAWTNLIIGNLNRLSVEQIWNGHQARQMRLSVLDGSFRYCDRSRCPFLQTVLEPVFLIEKITDPELLEIIKNRLTLLPFGPREIICSYDRSCNLYCPSCRRERIVEDKGSILRIEKKIRSEALSGARLLYMSGSGDPFGSLYSRQWLKSMSRREMPNLEAIHIHSNGQLWTPKMWLGIPEDVRPLIRFAEISIDASRPETYHLNRRGGEWERLLRNLEFISKLRRSGPLEWLGSSMVVQNNNFEEMPDFVHMAGRLGFDTAYFSRLVNWGTYSKEEYASRAIHLPAHPRHREFIELLLERVFDEPVVSLGNLTELRDAHRGDRAWPKRHRIEKPTVSIIIPARNAEATIAETLKSVLAQTYPHWEAIIVDDGSSDGTVEIVRKISQKDGRIRFVSRSPTGVSSARNAGVELSSSEWLLFLDADDLILPGHLKRMAEEIQANPTLDAVSCAWGRIDNEGTCVGEFNQEAPVELFPVLTRYCTFAIHSCLVRKCLVQEVGGFDTGLSICEDWDLWQRIARKGAAFGWVPEVLALYRMRSGAATLNAKGFMEDAIRVIERGHSTDHRVASPSPAYAEGAPIRRLPGAKLLLAAWCAGITISSQQPPYSILDSLGSAADPELDPRDVANQIVCSMLFYSGRQKEALPELWLGAESYIHEFLERLEKISQASRLARRTRLEIENRILQIPGISRPLSLGMTHAVFIDINEPIPDFSLPSKIERLHCTIRIEGQELGSLTLPVCDGNIPAFVLADSIAAEFAWPILGRFFEATVYRDLRVERTDSGLSLWLGSTCLDAALSDGEYSSQSKLHDKIGWTVFLQQLWNLPGWSLDKLYNPAAEVDETAACELRASGPIAVEVSQELPHVLVSESELAVAVRVGGIVIGTIAVKSKDGIVRAGQIRAEITRASGLELCRAAVREALLGQSLDGGHSLRKRLATGAALRRESHDATSPGALKRFSLCDENVLVLGRRSYSPMETSASRCAVLPAANAEECIEAAKVTGDPVRYRIGARINRVVYAPDLINWSCAGDHRVVVAEEKGKDNSLYGRSHFETLFAKADDPWKYTTAYEQTKYEQTLAMVPSGTVKTALELACAEGHFTVQFARHVGRLTACDFSRIALKRARDRCSGLHNVEFLNLDFIKEPIPGCYDLIVCSEVLYYAGDRSAMRDLGKKLANSLHPGGHLLSAHANLVVDESDKPGFDWDLPMGAKAIGEVLSQSGSLQLVKELRTPLYRIQLFRKRSGIFSYLRKNRMELTELDNLPPISPDLAAHFLPKGGFPRRKGCTASLSTDRLPILMYHSVKPTERDDPLGEFSVSPEAFEEQIKYLREAGYYSVSLEEWRIAMEAGRPLPGLAVLLTFDDGYMNFSQFAWPILKKYGFTATVFLVAGYIGDSNRWDEAFGIPSPLLGWNEIRALAEEGVEFGSHSFTHPRLTSLAPEEIVREAARSRTVLAEKLGKSIYSFAYPYGDEDGIVRHLIGACGYTSGLSTRQGLSRLYDPLLALPRITVKGGYSFEEFVACLG